MLNSDQERLRRTLDAVRAGFASGDIPADEAAAWLGPIVMRAQELSPAERDITLADCENMPPEVLKLFGLRTLRRRFGKWLAGLFR